jgi:hypothetical protein
MYPSRSLSVAVCIAVIVSGLSVVTAGPVAAAGAGTGFETPVSEEQAGDVAEFRIGVPNGSTVGLTVTGPAYHTRVDVVDADGDGRVGVRLNTYLAGWQTAERSAYEAVGVDRIAGVSRLSPRRSAPLATGPYALALTGPVADRARLELTAASFDAAVPYAVPRDAHPSGVDDLRALSSPNRTVAAGDWAVVTFHASGLGGVARVDDPPATNLVYPNRSAPGVSATHTVRHTLAANGSPSTLTLDYDAGDGGAPEGLTRVSAATLAVGYDTDGDGRVDVDASTAIEHAVVPRSGYLTVALADAPTATAGDVLVVELPVRNPGLERADRVTLSVDGRRTTGTVEYGVRGSGALGNGLDLRLAPVAADGTVGATRTVSPAVHDVLLDGEQDRLSVFFDTRALDGGTYAATLALTPANPRVSTSRTLTTTFTVVDRRVSFVRPEPSFELDGTTVPVVVTTTLAPGSELRLHVTSPANSDVLQVYVLTVDEARTVRVEVTLDARLTNGDVRVVVRDGDTVVAGPRVWRAG